MNSMGAFEMGRYLKRIKLSATQCPQCKMWLNTYVYVYRNGACARTYGTLKGRFAFDKFAVKAKATFRVKKINEEWVRHPSNPKWADTEQVKSCCSVVRKVKA